MFTLSELLRSSKEENLPASAVSVVDEEIDKIFFRSVVGGGTRQQKVTVTVKPKNQHQNHLEQLLLGPVKSGKNITVNLKLASGVAQFRVVSGACGIYRSVTARVRDAELLTTEGVEFIKASLAHRLAVDGMKLPKVVDARFTCKTGNLLELQIAGDSLPDSLRSNPRLAVEGHDPLLLVIAGEPAPCSRCATSDHTPATCPVAAAEREARRCLLCGKPGHMRVSCPAKLRPKCHACGEEGHFKSRCPKVECFACGGCGHMARSCPGRRAPSPGTGERPAPTADDGWTTIKRKRKKKPAKQTTKGGSTPSALDVVVAEGQQPRGPKRPPPTSSPSEAEDGERKRPVTKKKQTKPSDAASTSAEAAGGTQPSSGPPGGGSSSGTKDGSRQTSLLPHLSQQHPGHDVVPAGASRAAEAKEPPPPPPGSPPSHSMTMLCRGGGSW